MNRLTNELTELYELWNNALITAGENNQKAIANKKEQKNNTEGGEKKSIREDARGFYVNIDRNQDMFNGLSKKESIAAISKYMNDNFKGKVFPLSTDSKAFVGRTGIKEYSHPARKNVDEKIFDAKLKAGTELDNLLAVSVFDKHLDDRGTHPEATGGWDYYKTTFKVGDAFFEGTVSIEIRDNGREFKDITKIKEINRYAGQNSNESADSQKISFDNNIPQSDKSVNSSISENGGKDTKSQEKFSNRDSEGNELSEAQQEYFKDSKVRDEDGNLLVVYHDTDADFTVFDKTKARANMDIQGNFFSPWEIDALGYGKDVKAYYLDIKNPAPEGVAYKALHRFTGQNNAGVKAREYLISQEYDGVNNSGEEYIAFYPEQIKLIDNLNPTENEDIRFSDRENGQINIDRYTEKQYNNYGWVAVNEVLTGKELKKLYSQFANIKNNKNYNYKNRNGEYLIPVGDKYDSYDKLVYIKGTNQNPIIRQVISVIDDVAIDEEKSNYIKEILDYETRYHIENSWEAVEAYAGKRIFSRNSLQDYDTYNEIKRGKRNGRGEQAGLETVGSDRTGNYGNGIQEDSGNLDKYSDRDPREVAKLKKEKTFLKKRRNILKNL